jgi:PhzF family phenazine biosynthesis protein
MLAEEREAAWMQGVAAEMNLSETAFVRRRGDGSFNLRWFTPRCEVDMCGHATLATAHVLWEVELLQNWETAVFHTRSGTLTAVRRGEWIQLDFPTIPFEPVEPQRNLERALGVAARSVVKTRFGYLVEVESAAVVRAMAPNLAALRRIPGEVHIVTSTSDLAEYDIVSRVFAPAIGIDEDPVTGAAHCCLGPYWHSRTGSDDFAAYQASPRGGAVVVRVRGDRVLLEGQAVTVMRGELLP